VDFLSILFVVFLLIADSESISTTSWLPVVVSLAVLLSFLVLLLLFPFSVVVAVSSEVDDDLTGFEADEVAAVAECQLVSS